MIIPPSICRDLAKAPVWLLAFAFLCSGCELRQPQTVAEKINYLLTNLNSPMPELYQELGSFRVERFDTGYMTLDPSGGNDDAARAAIFQSDGKLLVAGRADNGTHSDFVIARYWLDGSLDTSFGSAGVVTTVFAQGEARGHSIDLDAQGRIYVAGRRWGTTDYDFGVARYLSDGSIDTDFGTGGDARVVLQGDDFTRGVKVDSLGRVYLGGFTKLPAGVFNFGVARLLSDGTHDTAFGVNGITTIGSANNDYVTSLDLDSADRPTLAGAVDLGTGNQFLVVKFSTTGAIVAFDVTDVDTGDDTPFGMEFDTSDRPVLVGRTHDGADYNWHVLRYNATFTADDFNTSSAFTANRDSAHAIVHDNSGRILVAGHSGNGANFDMRVARYTAAGALDATFGTAGSTTVAVGSGNDFGWGIAYQDGKIVAVGKSDSGGGDSDMSMARFNDDGSLAKGGDLDLNFSTDGNQLEILAGAGAEAGYSMQLDDQGRMVLVGQANQGIGFARFGTGGALDATFSGDGMHSEVVSGSTGDFSYGMAIQPDGKILAPCYDNGNFGMVRMTTGGTLDATFATAGEFSQNVGGGSISYGTGVALDSQNRILGCGSAVGFLNDFVAIRLTTAGALDGGFNGGGVRTLNMGATGGIEIALDCVVDSQDRTILTGYVQNATWDVGVARVLSNGNPDTSFNTTGQRVIDLTGSNQDFAWRAKVDSQNRIYLLGASNNDMFVLRLLSDGSNDGTFGTAGLVRENINAGDFAYDMNFQPNGKIVVVGASGGEVGIMRLLSNGALDTSFGGDGKATVDIGAGNSGGYGVTITTDGRIWIGGTANDGAGNEFAVLRVWP